jgi:N6-L-threonylcarbamoyladenine synthase
VTTKNYKIEFPAISLLVSGGHTELVLIKNWQKYKVIGQTRDDAVGEAFDKVARLLGLPYPGGPEISRLASQFTGDLDPKYKLPRPMQHSGDLDFSFSGLKTAVLYLVRKIEPLTEEDKKSIAYEFQTSAVDVLIQKTLKAIEKNNAKTLIVGGGVIANKELKYRIKKELAEKHPEVNLLLPDMQLSTDNATMIAIAAYFRSLAKKFRINPKIKAEGNLSL